MVRFRTPDMRPLMAVLAGVAAFLVGCPAAVAETAPVMTSSPPPAMRVGTSYVHMFQASGVDPTFRVTAGSLPPGMALQPTGFLTGVPTTAGSFGPTTVCGVDEPALPACQTFTIAVQKRLVGLLAAPSSGGPVGTAVRETATLVGGIAPAGSVTFRLFSDSGCTVEVFSSTNPVSGGAATSSDFTPAAPGTFRWTASYGGDANHDQASAPCDTTNSVVITTATSTPPPVASQAGTYHSLPPARVLDTRNGAPLGAGATIVRPVTGVGGVPASGVSAVAVNVTVTGATAPSRLTVYPSGAGRPLVDNLDFGANQTVSNLVVTKVGGDGKVAIYNEVGSTHVVFDVVGWFGSDGTTSGGRYNGLTPARILDTRYSAPVGAGGTIVQQVTGVGGVPATGVSAVVLNVTVTGPTAPSWLTVYPSGDSRPTAANLNFVANQTVPNLVISKVSRDGKVAIYNDAGSTHVVFDVVGWFGTESGTSSGGQYSAVLPARILDTRTSAPVAAGGTLVHQVTGVGGVPATGVSAVVLNVTVTEPTAASWLTVFPSGEARPLAANLNFVANQTVPNLVISKVGSDGKVAIYNQAGSADVILDVVGWSST